MITDPHAETARRFYGDAEYEQDPEAYRWGGKYANGAVSADAGPEELADWRGISLAEADRWYSIALDVMDEWRQQ